MEFRLTGVFPLTFPNWTAFAQPVSEGTALFRKACIGCHDMGGNILQPVSCCAEILVWSSGAQIHYICFDYRLFLTCWLIMPGSHSFPEGSREVTCHMQTEECACSHCSLLLTQRRQTCRNGVATEEELYSITYYGKGRMPVSSTS